MDPYTLIRFRLTLSSFSGIVPFAKHYWCRLRWIDLQGQRHEADAEHGRGDNRTGSFDTKDAARAAGVRLAKKLADGGFYIVTEGSEAVIDPQETLAGPGNLRTRLNRLYRAFEAMDGWDAPKERWPDVQKICDDWTSLMGAVREED